MNFQARINHCHRVLLQSHFGRAYGVENGRGDVSCQFGQFFIRLVLHTWFEFLRLVFSQSTLRNNFAGNAQGVCGYFPVFSGAEVVWCNGRCIGKLIALDVYAAPASGVQIAHAGGEGGKVVQRLAKSVQT